MMGLRNTVFLLFLLADGVAAMLAQEAISIVVTKTGTVSSCRSLKGMKIPASTFDLPTTGAYESAAKLVRDHRGEYCKVLGGVRPVDSSARDIRFEVNLPTRWNRKAVQFGGGTPNGWLGGPTSGLKRGAGQCGE